MLHIQRSYGGGSRATKPTRASHQRPASSLASVVALDPDPPPPSRDVMAGIVEGKEGKCIRQAPVADLMACTDAAGAMLADGECAASAGSAAGVRGAVASSAREADRGAVVARRLNIAEAEPEQTIMGVKGLRFDVLGWD